MSASIPIENGGKQYKSQREFKDYVSDLVNNKIGFCTSVKNLKPEYHKELISILSRNPKYEEKSSKMIDIEIVPTEKTKYKEVKAKEVRIINNDKSKPIPISWANFSITGKEETIEAALTVAMRTSSEGDSSNYRKTVVNICETCLTSVETHVDHIEHFHKLKTKFLEIMKTQNIFIPIRFGKVIRTNQKCFLEEDKDFEDKWKEYHNNEASLRILCGPCNQKRTHN